ncbi:Protein of unknown function (DUF1566) [Desulfocapsa sulfexigens DSM 10523]|uniref:Lcl C-terminal domain-containing protein n=1 Tax=Desulfocapsa sulfexigens (strain DSM 10523 / SB164P1) TaxID=1167006 RepID=M1NZG6_DESSD|nr:DUF1566 domain-containing protein [Desulfocapsa sulfexigens]AGF76658.1 Protein of unknown function (DUF1566) [Desulfocapsa sulfexigens DSM 10523]
MLLKQTQPDIRRPPRPFMQKRSARIIMGSTLLLSVFVLFGSLAHTIGPYTARINTVIDQGTGLEWQKNSTGIPHTWQNALLYCEDLSLDSKTDWRVPNIRELKSLADYSRYYPAIDPVIPSESSVYWSATTAVTRSPTSAWTVFFGNGDDIWADKSKTHYVRCVRSESSGQ